MRRPRELKYAHLLTWQADMLAKAWIPWAAWQVPADRYILTRWAGEARIVA